MDIYDHIWAYRIVLVTIIVFCGLENGGVGRKIMRLACSGPALFQIFCMPIYGHMTIIWAYKKFEITHALNMLAS